MLSTKQRKPHYSQQEWVEPTGMYQQPPDHFEIVCPKCGAQNPFLQTQAGASKKDCLRHIIEFILIFIPIIGWAVLAFSFITDWRNHTGATCQKCAHHWFISKKDSKRLARQAKI